MKTALVPVVSLATSFFAFAACGGGSSNKAAVDHWLGDTPHLAISGTFQGQTFDVNLQGDAASGIFCHRFYCPLVGTQPDASGNYDTSQMYFTMKELGGVIDLEGTPTTFTISYWRHDVAAGTDLTVIPRTFGTAIPDGETWSDINLFPPGADDLTGIESASASGIVSMKLNTGTPDQGGIVIPSGGRTGEFFAVSWGPTDNLNVSATADCSPYIPAPWAQSRLLP
jgi:hypothetical protein